MYQKCPICLGCGEVPSDIPTAISKPCPTCHGAKIIDEVTGMPPEGQIPHYQDISIPSVFRLDDTPPPDSITTTMFTTIGVIMANSEWKNRNPLKWLFKGVDY